MKDTLNYIITSIVDNPDQVTIEESDVDGINQYVVSVAKDDMGKVIGKEGKVIRSIRNIMKIKAIKHGVRINISLSESAQNTA